ncbi:MAG: carboxypeptidase regulatory-like domain-containing protein, partial [candidate division WOR-3 bacterium]
WRAQGGTAAMSELETQAIKKAFDRDAFSVWMSYHGGALVTLYPWGYHSDAVIDTGEFRRVCASYARATGNRYGSIYSIMYYCAGSTIDHFYGGEGMLAIGAEVHSIKTPPASSIDSLFNAHRDPMLDLMRYAKQGIEGIVTDSFTGQPIARAFLEPTTPARWVSYTDSPNGDYHRYLRPGTYTIRFSANGYNSKTVSNIVVPSDTSVVLNVRLVPNQTQRRFAYKVSMCNVADPNQAYANHSLTHWALGLRDGRRLSIGVGGWVDFDMGTPVVNRTGNDFIVVEDDSDVERCTVYVANNWNGPWTRLGIANGTTEFDLQTGGQNQARYIRLRDDGDGSANAPTAGFDVDAIEVYPLLGIEEKLPLTSKPRMLKLQIDPNLGKDNIHFHIEATENEKVLLSIFDISGRVVNQYQLLSNATACNFVWPCRDRNGKKMPAGVYFVRLDTDEQSVTQKILLIQ